MELLLTVSKSAGKPILKGLDLTVNAGEVHAVMGPNGARQEHAGAGAGRSAGYDVTGGRVTYEGQDLLAADPGGARAAGSSWRFSIRSRSPV